MEDDLILAEYGSTVIAMEILRERANYWWRRSSRNISINAK
ncbi:hypothetical protein [Paenibacillus sp. N3.4]